MTKLRVLQQRRPFLFRDVIWNKAYTNKLTTNRKPIHGGQRVCEENKLELELELEKNDCL